MQVRRGGGVFPPILRNLPRNFVEVPGFFIVRVEKSHGSWRGSMLVFSFLFSAIRVIKGNKNPTASASVRARQRTLQVHNVVDAGLTTGFS